MGAPGALPVVGEDGADIAGGRCEQALLLCRACSVFTENVEMESFVV